MNLTTRLELNLRNYMSQFDVPKLEVILQKLSEIIPGEFVGQELTKHLTGIIHIFVEEEVDPETLAPVPFVVRKRFSNQTEVKQVPLTAIPVRGRDTKDGTLITILNCARTKEQKNVGNEVYDEYFSTLGDIVKATEFQKYQKTAFTNGNRYLVLKIENIKNIPGTIEIKGEKFYTRFKGQTWRCSRCQEEHLGPCPYLKAFYQAKEERKKMEITHRIVSDSTLRRVESTGLSADVLCVPGGGLGDLANAIVDDPEWGKYKTITVIGGINDVMDTKSYKKESEYDHCIEASLKKFAQIADENHDIKITIIPPLTTFEGLSKDHEARLYMLNRKIEGLANETERIEYKLLTTNDVTFTDIKHPDEGGTLTVLQKLNKICPKLIINKAFITHSRYYGGTESTFRWGCKTCFTEGNFDQKRCPTCINDAGDFVRSPHLQYELDEYMKDKYPILKRDSPPSSPDKESKRVKGNVTDLNV